MSHQLPRIRNSLIATPLLMQQSKLTELIEYLDSRGSEGISEDYKLAIEETRIAKAQNKMSISETGVGVIPVTGSLTYEKTQWEALCGNTSYQTIQEQFDTLLKDSSVNTIVLDVNSSGGSAYSVFELTRYMRERATSSGVKLITYVDGLSASAAYALSSASDEIIMNPQSEAGSIGVVMRLMNNNKALEKAGIETTYVFSGDSKIPFDKEGNFREDFIEELQTKCDELYDEFSLMVSDLRGISEQDVKDTQAGVFTAKKAVELGLADSIMTRQEFFDYLADSTGDSMPLNMNTTKTKEDTKMSADTQEVSQVSLESFNELQAQLTAQLESNAEMSAFLAEAKEEKAKLAKQAHDAKLADLSTKFGGYSFAKEDSAALVELADTLDEGKQTLLFNVFDKASNLVTEAVEEELVVEGETEVELSTGDVDAQKKATANAIAAKYTTSA